MRALAWAAPASAVLLALPGAAWAHAPQAGVDGFYAGVSHPFTVPGAVMAIVALGLLAGQRGDDAFLAAWSAFIAGAVAGMALAIAIAIPQETPLALLAFAAVAGSLAAAALKLPRAATLGLGAIAGVMIGVVAAPDPGPLGSRIVTAAGALASSAILFLFVAGLLMSARERFQQAWLSVGMRVLGSWILAIAVLMAALSLAPGTAGAVHLP